MNGTWTPERHAVRDETRRILHTVSEELCGKVDELLDKMTDVEIKKAVAHAHGPFPARLSKMLVQVALERLVEAYYCPPLINVKRAVLKAERRP
jgi:hypothetical protein